MSKKITAASARRKKALREAVLFPAEQFVAELEAAEDALQTARLVGSGADEAKAKLDEVVARASEHEDSLVFEFRGIGREAYAALLADCPPTDKQKEKDPSAQWNPDVFAPALCAASCENTDMDADEFRKEIFQSDEFGPGELNRLFGAALRVNTSSKVVELGN